MCAFFKHFLALASSLPVDWASHSTVYKITPTLPSNQLLGECVPSGAGAEIVEEMIKENVFWSNRNMKEQGWQPTERGQLWDDALDFAYQDDACRSTFQTMLRWETRMGPTSDSLHALIVTVETTNAESIDTFCVIGMLAGLAINPKVCQLEITPQQTVANDNAQWLTQTGVKNERPFFDVGLDGTGQVVAVSDTGVDRDSCYFGDSTSVGVSYTSGNDKFVLYDDYVNSNDYQYGHGTHGKYCRRVKPALSMLAVLTL